jgi:hypothetical protein
LCLQKIKTVNVLNLSKAVAREKSYGSMQ